MPSLIAPDPAPEHARLVERTRRLEAQVSDAAHDLQAPLRALRFLAERLCVHAGQGLDPRAREVLDRLLGGARSAELLVQQMLRPLAADAAPAADLIPVDLQAVLADVRADLCAELDERPDALEVAPLPQVLGRRADLRRLFTNLLDNALRAPGVGRGPRVSVHAQRDRRAPRVRIEVQDDGPGLPPRAVAPARHGRGLAICRRIAREHGGRLVVRSRPGHGTQVSVWLRLAAP